MSRGSAAGGAPGRARQARRVLVAAALSLTMAVAAIGGTVVYEYWHLDGNITTAGDLNTLTHRPKELPSPPNGGPPINILLLGSQTRDGQQGQFGDSAATGSFGGSLGTDNSDTSMLLHLAGDRKHAMVVSIPRDTMVARPECPGRDGKQVIPASDRAIFDSAMSLGGPLCAAATVEQMWNVRVDDFIRLDFNGFRKIVTYLGGVRVCIPPPGIDDPYSHLKLPAGLHVVTGDEALAFVRDRHGIGDGSDLGRIKMQQMFLSSLVAKVESDGTLQDPGKLLALADVATSSMTTDVGLGSVDKLLGLANEMRGLKTHNMTFVTMPTVYDQWDPNRVDPAPSADVLWTLVRNDQWLDGTSVAAKEAAEGASSSAAAPSLPGAGTTPSGLPSAQGSSPAGTLGATQASPDSALPDFETRQADQNICKDLPTPNGGT